MNVNQMHIAIRQGVDKINSLQADMLLREEIDIELNKSMSRFLNTKYGKNNKYGQGFENSQKRIDDLRTLVKEYSAPTTYKEQYDNNHWIDQFRLPSDYLYLVNQRSEVFINNCEPIPFGVDETSPTSFFVLPISHLHDSNSIVNTLDIYVDPGDVGLGTANVFTNPPAPGTFVYPQDLQPLKDFLINPFNWPAGMELYYEEYGDLSFPDSIIIVVDPVGAFPWFNWDSSITNVVSGTNLITSLVARNNNIVDPLDPTNEVVYGQYVENGLGAKRLAPEGSTREYALNKFIQQDDIFKLLDDPFNTTKHTSPLTTIRGRYIDIYTSDIFIIDKLKITYIRKPKQISLPLAVGCELPEHTHQEIVDMTVGSILEGISDPRYKSQSVEVAKNE